MIPGSFDYHRPRSVDEAVGLLARLGEDSRVLAGGHSLIPMMKLRLALPEHLIDLQDLGELRGIALEGGDLVIGAMVTQAELIASSLAGVRCPILAETSRQIADPQVRACGTLGGNVANGDPGNDMPAVMLALDARYGLRGPSGSRTVAARDFYEGAYFTKLAPGEILAEIRIPLPPVGHGYAYEKQKRKTGDYATAAAAVVLGMSGGSCATAAIALTNVGETPLLAGEAADLLVGTALDAETVAAAGRAAADITSPAVDGRGPAEFRKHVARVMVERAVLRAAGVASGRTAG